MEEQKTALAEITAEDITNLPASPEFRLWAESIPRKRLQDILRGLQIAGVCNNNKEGLQYLSQIAIGSSSPKIIAKGDFEDKKSNPLFTKLSKLIGNGVKSDPYGLYGHLGHMVLPKILSHELFQRPTRRMKRYYDQLSLFEKHSAQDDSQRNLFAGLQQKTSLTKKVKIKYLNPRWIEPAWKIIVSSIERQEKWPDWYLRSKKQVAELHRLLTPVLELETVSSYKDWLERGINELTELTLLSWATAVIWSYKIGKKSLFTEVSVLAPHKDGLGGGRVDSIELVSVDGQAPNEMQRQILSNLRGQRFQSIGQLQSRLKNLIKGDLKFQISDWKFSIGDGGPGRMLSQKEIPTASHLGQILEYQAFSGLSSSIEARCQNGQMTEEFWRPFNQGALVYFFPETEPQTFQVATDANQIFCLLRETASSTSKAETVGQMREMTNQILGHVIYLLEGKRIFSKPTSLFPIERNPKPAVQFLRGFPPAKKEFVDEFQIIEKRRKKSGDYFVMHFNRLEECIKEGKVRTDKKGIGPQGGFIDCLFHGPERTPSLYVNLKVLRQGRVPFFHCFGCGASGIVKSIPDGLQKDLAGNASAWFQSRPGYIDKSVQKIAVPEDHALIMERAQKLLQAAFPKSKAEEYLRGAQRLIDPDLAFSMGAGFADERLIVGLLDTGYYLEDLIKFGLVGYSEYAPNASDICSLLRKRGIKIEKEVDSLQLKKGSGPTGVKKVIGYPFLTLKNRLTFPLHIAGKITSFYGRTVTDGKPKHLKLSVGIPHGAFNTAALDSESPEVFVTEAVIESLSLIMMKIATPKNTTGLIGIINDLLVNLLGDSGKKIAVALNYDEPKWDKHGQMRRAGQDATDKIIQRLSKRGTEAYDFTAKYIMENPQTRYGDYNDFWRRIKSA